MQPVHLLHQDEDMTMDMGDNLGAPNTARQPLARLGPSPRASVAPSSSAGLIIGSQAQNSGRGHQDSTIVALESPSAAGLPPLPPLPWSNPTVGPDARRHSSMHDAALDVLQSTYPPPLNQLNYGVSPTQPSPQQQGLWYPSFNFEPAEPSQPLEVPGPQPSSHQQTERRPIAYHSPNPIVYGSRDSKKVYHMGEHSGNDGAGVNKAGFSFRKYVGYICIICGRVCPKPGEHRTLGGGAGCVDFSLEYRSMQPWRGLGGEGMRVCQGQAQEEQRGGTEVISEMHKTPSQKLDGEQR